MRLVSAYRPRQARIHGPEADIPLSTAARCLLTLRRSLRHGQSVQMAAPGALKAKAKNAATPSKANATI
jgi:hypothetical protein